MGSFNLCTGLIYYYFGENYVWQKWYRQFIETNPTDTEKNETGSGGVKENRG